jgi:hypothetical protein
MKDNPNYWSRIRFMVAVYGKPSIPVYMDKFGNYLGEKLNRYGNPVNDPATYLKDPE